MNNDNNHRVAERRLQTAWTKVCATVAKVLNLVMGDPSTSAIPLQPENTATTNARTAVPEWTFLIRQLFASGFRQVVAAGERRESTLWLLFVPVICVSFAVFGLFYVFFAVLLLFVLHSLHRNERREQEFRNAFLRALITDNALQLPIDSASSFTAVSSLSTSNITASASGLLTSSLSNVSIDRDNEGWANRALAKWWRTSAQLFLSHHLPTVEEKINNIRPKFLQSLCFNDWSLGDAVPHLQNIQVKTDSSPATTSKKLCFTAKVFYVSDAKFELMAKMSNLNVNINVNFVITNITIAGNLRVEFDLLKKEGDPFGISISILGEPMLDFAVKSIVDLTSVPLLSDWLHEVSQNFVRNFLVFPQSFNLSLWGAPTPPQRTAISFQDDYITEIGILSVKDGEFDVPMGWTIVPKSHQKNINANLTPMCGDGKGTYLCYKRGGKSPPIVDLAMWYSDRDRCSPPRDYNVLSMTIGGRDANLNFSNMDGSRLYLCYKRSQPGSVDQPIIDLAVIMSDVETLSPGMDRLPVNLNKGIKGRKVFIGFKRKPTVQGFPHSPRHLSRPPIVDIAVVMLDRNETCIGSGWELMHSSLSGLHTANICKGSGMHRIFIAVRRSNEGPCISDIKIISPDRKESPPPGFNLLSSTPTGYDANLNAGTNGSRLYLCYKKSVGQNLVVTDIQIFFSDYLASEKDAFNDPSYEILPQDLNEGSGGRFIYLAVKKEYQSSPSTSNLTGSPPPPSTILVHGITSPISPPSLIALFSKEERRKNKAKKKERELAAVGINHELKEYVNALFKDYNLFADFPLDDEHATFQMSELQAQHAIRIIKECPVLDELRYQLCPRAMKENTFWYIYFLLMRNKLQFIDVEQQQQSQQHQPQNQSQHQHQQHHHQQHQEGPWPIKRRPSTPTMSSGSDSTWDWSL
eukprot:TRINITY_DN4553_c0_g1_i2.p1 TRINITY_DN4553_c0_g1~~TRINITY_DN4553_c0_g1_i2.p1  ORF type:complete len:956 (-),score=163.62 TRINITY_DN4553_c0_g1_i2:90-2846(-)